MGADIARGALEPFLSDVVDGPDWHTRCRIGRWLLDVGLTLGLDGALDWLSYHRQLSQSKKFQHVSDARRSGFSSGMPFPLTGHGCIERLGGEASKELIQSVALTVRDPLKVRNEVLS